MTPQERRAMEDRIDDRLLLLRTFLCSGAPLIFALVLGINDFNLHGWRAVVAGILVVWSVAGYLVLPDTIEPFIRDWMIRRATSSR